MDTPARQPQDRLRNKELMLHYGERLRWLREAWERHEPGRHSQVQWARNLGVGAPVMHRWEAGMHRPNLFYEIKIQAFYLVSPEYLQWGALSKHMPKWLYDDLAAAHPELQDEAIVRAELSRIVAQATRLYRREKAAGRS